MYRAAVLPQELGGGRSAREAPQHGEHQDGENGPAHTSVDEFPRAGDGDVIILKTSIEDSCGREAIAPVARDRMILMPRRLTHGVI